MVAIFLFLLAGCLLFFLRFQEVQEVSYLEYLFNYIETNNGILRERILKRFNGYRVSYVDKDFYSVSEYLVQEGISDYEYIEYTSMGHCTGKPVRFLSVYYDKAGNFTKAKLDIGMSNTITKEYLKK